MDKDFSKYKYWLCLGRNVKFTAALFNELYALDRPVKELFEAEVATLKGWGLSERCVTQLIDARSNFEPDHVVGEMITHNVRPIFIFEDEYPRSLKEIFSPPFILYVRGTINLDQLMVGVVGSRRMTGYGIRATEYIAGELAANGVIIVSGMALGIDTIAHQAALNEGGKTIAVLGCGLDRVYPSSNLQLARDIVENGAIVSEFPIGTRPALQNFPARNRIISGLSMGLVVTEAAESSGSLITAKAALDQNREVFAVPGEIFNLNSVGTNNLIKMGARLVTSAQDVFDEFGIKNPEIVTKMRELTPKTNEERIVIGILELEPYHIDDIIKKSGLSHNVVSSTLTMMEVTGKVKHIGNMTFRLNN